MKSTDIKLCPFKKIQYNFGSTGVDVPVDIPVNVNNLVGLSYAKAIREEFGKCDKENCMAFNSDIGTCKRI